MDKTTADIRNAMAKIPGLKDLVIPWERLQSDEEFQKMNDEFMKGLMASFDAEIDCDLDYDFGSPSAPASGAPAAAPGAVSEPVAYGSRRITIRITGSVLAAFKKRARDKGTKYQTLVNRTLRSAVASWSAPERPL